jgi:hypothetical protein
VYELRNSEIELKVFVDQVGSQISLTDIRTGIVWGPTTAFRMEVYSIMLRRDSVINESSVEVNQGATWIDVKHSVDNLTDSASVTVRFSLEKSELVARILSNEIKEMRPELSLLSGVDLLPELLTLTPQDCYVLPYGNGALCYPGKHPGISDQFLIYGEQHQWEKMPQLPCIGAINTENQSALLLIAEQGEFDAQCRIKIDQRGFGKAGFCLKYLYTPIDSVDPIERVLRVCLLRDTDATYAGMGRRLHELVRKKTSIGRLEDRAASFILKIMLACKDIGPTDGTGELRVMTTFDEACQQLLQIKCAGIDKLCVQLTGWNFEGHDGAWPTRFPVEEKLGGERSLRALLHLGTELGFQMQVHDNYIDLYQRSEFFDPNMCVGSVYGAPLQRGCWAGGINHLGWPLAYDESMMTDQMTKVKSLGISGMAYLDAMGVPLELSYIEHHGDQRYRRAHAEGVNHIIRAARSVYGAAGIETGYLYCAVDSDYVGSLFHHDFDCRSELVDVKIPLWIMAMKGHAILNLSDTYNCLASDHQTNENLRVRRLLQLAEYGILPRNEIVANPGAWGYPLDPALPLMTQEYDLMINKLGHLSLTTLIDHKISCTDKETGKYTAESRFSDGTHIISDYINGRLTIDGEMYGV